MKNEIFHQHFAGGPSRVASLLVLGIFLASLAQGILIPRPAQAISNSWTFDVAGDFTVTANKVKITGGQAQLGRTPDWWDTSYAYRKKITVTAGTTAVTTDDTITLNTDTAALVTAGKLQADRDDLRVVYWNGTTNANIDREYISEGLGNPTANNDVRFKAQAAISASASDAGYYIYYGNGSTAAGPVNPANVYRYYQGFSTNVCSGGGWTCTDGSWSSASSILDKTADGSDDDYAYDTANSFDRTLDWYFETTWRRQNNQNTVSPVVFHSTEAFNQGWWMTTSNFGGIARSVDIRDTGGAEATGSVFSVTNGTWYRGTVRYDGVASPCVGTGFTGYINGSQYVSGSENDNSNCPTALHPAAHTWTAQGEWDDYKVWKSLGETATLGSEEPVYPSDDPTVTPSSAITLNRLDSFSETSTLNGGAIKYILSNDGGTTWSYHNGSVWTASDGSYSQSTTAANVNTNASTFPGGSGSFLWRAFLHSDGTQLVQLDTVTVNGNQNPVVPSLSSPADGASVTAIKPTLQLSATDGDSDYLRYKIQLDTANTFNTANLQTLDLTASQTGWTGQDSQGGTAYATGTSASFTLQTALTPGTTYYWRAAAIDPGGINSFTSYSAARSFVTPSALTASTITAASLTSTGVTITWTTSRDATTVLDYGTTTAYGTSTTVSGTRSSHEVSLNTLTPGTLYHYRVSGTDATGQTVTSVDQTFTTLSGAISGIQVTGITTTGALVSWTSNVATTSRVEYGTTTDYGSSATTAGSVASHQVSLTGLTPGTLYHYRVTGTDSGGTAVTSADQTFTTLASTVITNIQVTPLTSHSVRVTWTTNHPADSKVRYGTTTDYGSEVYSSMLVTDHEMTIGDLASGVQYHYEVLSVGNTSTNDADATFTTLTSTPTILQPTADDVFTSAQIVDVIGLALAGQTVTVYVDGVEDGTTTAASSTTGTGAFRYRLSKTLSVGTHTLAVKGTLSGNVSPLSPSLTIAVTLPAVGPTLLTPLVTDGDNPQITIRGLAPSGARLTVYVDGKRVKDVTATTTSTGIGSFALTLSAAKYADGTHTVQVIAYDSDGKPSKLKTATSFTIKGKSFTPTSSKGFQHIVKGGESLWRIAQHYYGDGARFAKLVQANLKRHPGLKANPSLIQPGWILTIPK